jgi:hypothetical protein
VQARYALTGSVLGGPVRPSASFIPQTAWGMSLKYCKRDCSQNAAAVLLVTLVLCRAQTELLVSHTQLSVCSLQKNAHVSTCTQFLCKLLFIILWTYSFLSSVFLLRLPFVFTPYFISFFIHSFVLQSRSSSVILVTGLWGEWLGFDSRQVSIFFFANASSLFSTEYQELFPEGKTAGAWS